MADQGEEVIDKTKKSAAQSCEDLLSKVTKLTRAQKRKKMVLFSDDEMEDGDSGNEAEVDEEEKKPKFTTSEVQLWGVRGVGARWICIEDNTYLTYARWLKNARGMWIQDKFSGKVSLTIDEVKDMVKSFGDLLDMAKDTMKTENLRANEQEKEEKQQGSSKNKKMKFKWNRQN